MQLKWNKGVTSKTAFKWLMIMLTGGLCFRDFDLLSFRFFKMNTPIRNLV
jgi:hypothetical protein